MDYAIFIYYPNKKKVGYKIEQAQFAGIRTALGYRNSSSTNVMIRESKLMLMKHRAELLAVFFLSKKLLIKKEETERVMNKMVRRKRRDLIKNPNKDGSIIYKAWEKLKKFIRDLWTRRYVIYTTNYETWNMIIKKEKEIGTLRKSK